MFAATRQQSVVAFAGFRLDLTTCELSKNGRGLPLPQQPARVLALLVRRAGELVSREELRDQVWGKETFVDFEHGLNNCIKEIRATLGDKPSRPRFIETVPKRGYRFIASLDSVPGPAIDSSPLAVGAESAEPTATAGHLTRNTWIAAVAFLFLMGILGYAARRYFRPPAQAARKRIMVAVLPFQNLTGRATDEYVSDGFTEEMISQLGRLNADQLGVIARTSSMTYKGSRKPVKDIARELGVAYVLEGSVRSTPEGLRITAQFIRADDQTHLWAEEYDRPFRDLVRVQGEVAEAVAKEIQIRVSPQARSDLAAARDVRPEAYRAYLLGRFLWNQRSGESLDEAVISFGKAIEQDPNYAPAYAGLADTYNSLIYYGYRPGQQSIPKAKEAARRAVQLDYALAEGHASLGYVYFMWEHDWKNAEREFQKAIELDGSYSSAHQWYALYLGAMGRSDESLAQIEQARALDPLALIVTTASGYLAYYARRNELAIERCEDVLRRNPDFMVAHAVLGLAYEGKRDYPRAIQEFQKAIKLSGGRSAAYLDYLGHAYAAAGNRKEAEAVLAEFDKLGTSAGAGPSYRAATLLALGERAKALDALEEGFENSDGGLVWLKVDPRLDDLRTDPRYLRLLRHAGLVLSDPQG